MILVFSTAAPHYWVLTGNDGKFVQSGVADALSGLPDDRKIEQRIGVLPGDRVTIHQLDIPAKNKKLLMQAIPNVLEPDLASDIAELYFVLLRWIKGKSVTVAVVSREDIQQVLDELNEAGLKIDHLTPEYCLLPLKEKGSFTLALAPHGGVLVRSGPYSGFVLDEALVGQWVKGLADSRTELNLVNDELSALIPPQVGVGTSAWPVGSSPADWIKKQPIAKLPDVLPDEVRQKKQRSGKWLWLPLAASILLWLGVDAVEYVHLNRLNHRIEKQMTDTFRAMFPGVKRIELGRIRFQAKTEIAKRQGVSHDSGYFLLLDAVAKASRGSRATIQSIDYRKGEMVLYVKLPDYALADRLKQRFDQDRRVKVELIPSGSGDNEVTARYKLRVASS